MGMFDWLSKDEEEETAQSEAPAKPEMGPPKSLMNPQVREYLLGKDAGPSVDDANVDVRYRRAAADTSAVDKARADADSDNKWATVMQGIATMFAGPKKVDGSVFSNIRAANSAKADTAQADHRQKLADMLTHDKLGRQGVERAQEDKKFGWEEANKDPSQLTPGARLVMAKRLGVDARHLEGLSFDQAKQLQAAAEKGTREGRQLKAVETERGIEWYMFNPNNGAFEPTGQLTGYKLTTDGVTGTRTSGADKSAPVTDILTADGGTQRDLRTATEGSRAYVKGTAGQQVKNEQDVKVADADATHTDDMLGRWKNLYDSASKEGPVGNTGPIAGRAAQAASKLGVDMGPATNEAATEMEREMQSYVVKMTGLSSTDQQFKRLMSTAPHLGMSPEQFAARSKVWQDEVKRTVKKKRDIAFPGAKAAAAPEPAAPSSPASQYTPEQEATIKAYQEKYPSKTREQIIKAMGL